MWGTSPGRQGARSPPPIPVLENPIESLKKIGWTDEVLAVPLKKPRTPENVPSPIDQWRTHASYGHACVAYMSTHTKICVHTCTLPCTILRQWHEDSFTHTNTGTDTHGQRVADKKVLVPATGTAKKGVLGAFGGHHGDIFIFFTTEGRPCRPWSWEVVLSTEVERRTLAPVGRNPSYEYRT